jgi:voltage-gated sodium channel
MAKTMKDAAQAELPFAEQGGWAWLRKITESGWFTGFILACIIVNAITLGIDAHFGESNPWHPLFENLDLLFLLIFTLELVLEFLASGPKRYFKNGWNIFDVIVVGLCYLSTAPSIAALRTLRVLRVLRLVSNVPQMRRVVEALISATPGILATFMVLVVVFYIGSVMATTLFGKFHPKFADLGISALTLFQLSQFDGWGDMVTELNAIYPWAWAFVLAFTVLAAFAVLNLFIGVIVDAVQVTRNDELTQAMGAVVEKEVSDIEHDVEGLAAAQDKSRSAQAEMLAELRALRGEIAALRARLPGG